MADGKQNNKGKENKPSKPIGYYFSKHFLTRVLPPIILTVGTCTSLAYTAWGESIDDWLDEHKGAITQGENGNVQNHLDYIDDTSTGDDNYGDIWLDDPDMQGIWLD